MDMGIVGLLSLENFEKPGFSGNSGHKIVGAWIQFVKRNLQRALERRHTAAGLLFGCRRHAR
jgi:hypothetical protein